MNLEMIKLLSENGEELNSKQENSNEWRKFVDAQPNLIINLMNQQYISI